jgi:hypothetical protein
MAPQFRLGFLAFANLPIPEASAFAGERHMRDLFGEPLENERYAANGNSEQRTCNGLLVWRKADNWTAFTDGHRTWVNGPHGVQDRLNTERFPWEADGQFKPAVYSNPNPSTMPRRRNRDGSFARPFRGFLWHASHSTRRQDAFTEFHGTRGYAQSGAGGLAWHLTAGPGMISQHMGLDQWGYHARELSEEWIGIEIAKANVWDEIEDSSIESALWWIMETVLPAEAHLDPRDFMFHAETAPGVRDGKVDPYPNRSHELDQLRRRILAAL